MRGFLKNRGGGNQFLIVVSIALVSFFLVGLIGTLLLSKLSGMSLDQLSDMKKWNYADPNILFVIRGMQVVQFISLFVIPAWLAAWLFAPRTAPYLGMRKPYHDGYWVVGVGIMLVAIPFSVWLGEINKHIPFPTGMQEWMRNAEEEANQTVKALLSRRSVKDLLLNLVFIAGLAAVGEELLFRSVLQRLLIKWFRSPWAGIIIAAAIFSAIHMQFSGFLPRFLLGILLGAIYWFSGSLWVAILAHFIYDGVLITAAWFTPDMLQDDKAVNPWQLAIAGAVSFAGVIILLEWMRRRTQARYETVYAEDNIPFRDHPF